MLKEIVRGSCGYRSSQKNVSIYRAGLHFQFIYIPCNFLHVASQAAILLEVGLQFLETLVFWYLKFMCPILFSSSSWVLVVGILDISIYVCRARVQEIVKSFQLQNFKSVSHPLQTLLAVAQVCVVGYAVEAKTFRFTSIILQFLENKAQVLYLEEFKI